MAQQDRLVSDCAVAIDGAPLPCAIDAKVVRVEVELATDRIGLCRIIFGDADLQLMSGEIFGPGKSVHVSVGFQGKQRAIFDGEVVALEPRFARDVPPVLCVRAMERLHRLALSTHTRAFNDVDDRQLVATIARDHGLTGEAQRSPCEHVLQRGQTDAQFLRPRAQRGGHALRVEGKKLILGPPPKRAEIFLAPGGSLQRLSVRMRAAGQVEEIVAHGYDAKEKRAIEEKSKVPGDGVRLSSRFGKQVVDLEGVALASPEDAARIARSRAEMLADDHATADGRLSGNSDLLPGATLTFQKFGPRIDGKYRVESARHDFSHAGYRTEFSSFRLR